MIKRISLVWKRPELSDTQFRRIWLGEHVEYAKQLPGVREYTIDFVTAAPEGAPCLPSPLYVSIPVRRSRPHSATRISKRTCCAPVRSSSRTMFKS